MEWVIESGGEVLWDSQVTDPDLAVIDPRLSRSLNAAGQLTFKLSTEHPMFGHLNEGTSWVRVYKNGVLDFRGRVFRTEKPLHGYQDIAVEGALAAFNDTVAGPFNLTAVTPTAFLQRLVTDHNAQVLGPTGSADAERVFSIGTVDVSETALSRSIQARPLPNTWDAMMDRTVKSSVGGYLVLTGANLNVLNWMTDPGGVSTQELAFGENLMDLVHVADVSEMVTAVEAVGAESESGKGDFLTLDPNHPSVRALYVDGSGITHYGVVDPVLEAVAGRRVASIYSQDIKTRETLLKHANAELQARKNVSITIDANALELALVDSSVQEFQVGNSVRVTVPHMGISEILRVDAITYDLADAAGWSIRLGGARKSAVKAARDNTRTVNELAFSTYRLNEWSDQANTRLDEMVDGVENAKANAVAALLASGNLVRDPTFTSGEDLLGVNVLLRETAASVGEALPAGFTTAGRWLASKPATTALRAVIPSHEYEIKAWVKQRAEGVPTGAPYPAIRFRVLPKGKPQVLSPWLQLHNSSSWSPVVWRWRVPDSGVTAVQLGIEPQKTDLFVTGWSAQDVTAVAEARNALEGLRTEYDIFTTEIVQSLIEQSSDQIKLAVQTDRQIVAAILENMQNTTDPGGDILARAVEQYIASFTVDDQTIAMMFSELGSVTADINGLTTWQMDAQTWINFSASGIDMGRSTSGYRVHIDDDELTFYDGSVQLATFTNQKLQVRSVEVLDKLRIGTMEWRPGSRTGLWHLIGI